MKKLKFKKGDMIKAKAGANNFIFDKGERYEVLDVNENSDIFTYSLDDSDPTYYWSQDTIEDEFELETPADCDDPKLKALIELGEKIKDGTITPTELEPMSYKAGRDLFVRLAEGGHDVRIVQHGKANHIYLNNKYLDSFKRKGSR